MGESLYEPQDVPEWRAYDAYTVRRTGPLQTRRIRRDTPVDVLFGVLSLLICTGALWGWVWAVRAVLLPAWRAWWGR